MSDARFGRGLYNVAMKIANVAEFKNHLSEYLAAVQNGEELEIRKRNVPLARVVPVPARRAASARGFKALLAACPLDDVDLVRTRDVARDVEL